MRLSTSSSTATPVNIPSPGAVQRTDPTKSDVSAPVNTSSMNQDDCPVAARGRLTSSADFDLVRLVAEGEVDRERWSLSLQFLFLDEIPPDLIVHNPMGIVITYLQGDRAVVTGNR